MAFQAGKSGSVSVNGTVLSTFCTNCDGFPGVVAVLDTTCYGKNRKTYIPGLGDGTVTMTFDWDPTAATGPDAVISALITTPALVTIIHGPMGSTVGNVKYSVSAICTDWKVSTPVAGLITGTATFQMSDTVTVTVF